MKKRFASFMRGLVVVPAAVLVLCLIGSYMTRDAMTHLPFLKKHGAARQRDALVDQSPWDTVQTLAPLAITVEEQNYAREAVRLADHEVDQAFAMALRMAALRSRC